MVQGTEKVPQSIIGYKEYYTDTTVRFVVQMKPDKLREAQSKGLHKFFNLQNSLCCNNTLVSDVIVLMTSSNFRDVIRFCLMNMDH